MTSLKGPLLYRISQFIGLRNQSISATIMIALDLDYTSSNSRRVVVVIVVLVVVFCIIIAFIDIQYYASDTILTRPLHTNSRCGMREAHINWSMVTCKERAAPVPGTTLRTTAGTVFW